jgi:TetR/AcrR family transcriptional regulator, lmrAB and yxaGH operons repressor
MSREQLVSQLVDVFRLYGYDGASLACIAKETGLGKTNLYYYFPGGKAEMAAAALDRVDTWLETSILQHLRGGAKPIDKIQMMCDEVNNFFDRGQNSCLWAVLALGQSSDDLFHHQIKSALLQWIDALTHVLTEAGYDADLARCHAEDTILRIQGALVLARGLDDPQPFQRLMRSLVDDLLGKENCLDRVK